VKYLTGDGAQTRQIAEWRTSFAAGRTPSPEEQEMSGIRHLALVAGSILCLLETATGPPASAFERHIEITNNTRMAIVEIQIARVGTDRWEADLLGEDILLPAQSLIVDIEDPKGYCRFDLKTVFDDGATLIRRNVDVCAVERFAISYR
jgi:hypothetical protein